MRKGTLLEPFAAQVEAAVRHRAHGVAVLGLATETHKLDTSERRQIFEWTAQAIEGRLPFAVTVAEPSVQGQSAFVARSQGCRCRLGDPPAAGGLRTHRTGARAIFRRRGRKHRSARRDPERAPVPRRGPVECRARTLNRQHPNVCLLKGEAPAHVIERLVADTDGAYRVFNGRGGMEFPECLRAGCVGMIPAPECFDVQVGIYESMRKGDPVSESDAEHRYREILPLIVFLMSSIDTFICYGKRILGRRLGIDAVFDRTPSQRPTEFGLLMAQRLSSMLGPL